MRFSTALGCALVVAAASSIDLARADEAMPLPSPTEPVATSSPAPPSAEAPAVASPEQPSPRPSSQRLLSFELDMSKFDYAEDFPPPGKSTENGVLPSLWVAYRWQRSPTSNYWSAGLELSPGGTHYDGTTQAPKYTPVQQDTSNRFVRTEGVYGLNLFCFSRETYPGCLKLYSGLGLRVWIRGQSQVVNGVASPSEHYSWLYLPIGLRFEKQLGESLSVALDASARWMFAGTIQVMFSELASSYNDAGGALGNQWGERVEMPIQYKLRPKFGLEAVPWFEYSGIGQGDLFDIVANGKVVGQGFEPASRTYQYGARLGIVLTY